MIAAAWLIALAAQPEVKAPAAPYVDRPVASVVVSVEGRPTNEAVLIEAVQTKVGKPLAMRDVRETITHMYSLGRFEDVRVEAQMAPAGGVALTFELAPIHIVTTVEFRGQLGLSEGALRRRMVDRFGATPPLARAADVAAALTDLYHERGYLSAAVRPAPPIIGHKPEQATLIFQIDAGPRTTIAHSTIAGHPLDPAADVQRRLGVEPGQPYEPAELQTRLADYRSAMRRRGRYEADARARPPSFTPDRLHVDITIEIEPGPLVTVQITGDPLPKDKIAELVPIEREGSVDQDILEDSARRIEDYLNQQGYWKARVNPPERRDQEGRLTIVFDVHRGQVYRVAPDGIEVVGNQSVPIEELRPLLRMSAGEPFVSAKLGAIEHSIAQLYKTKGFAMATVLAEPNDAGEGRVKPIVKITEGARITIGRIRITGNRGLLFDDLIKTATAILKPGDPYYGPTVAAVRDALLADYVNAGYVSANISVAPIRPVANPDGSAVADVAFDVDEGEQTIVDHVFITGNLRTKESVIRRELRVRPGAPLGLEDVTESRRRLSALGLFRRIQISTISHGDASVADVVVQVEEAPQTTYGFGGGAQVDRIFRTVETGAAPRYTYEVAPRGFFEIGRRNLGGRNRSANLYTRLSLRPSSDPEDRNPFGFSEYRIVGTVREPRALRRGGDLTMTAAVEQGVRTGFNFIRKGLNADLTRQLAPKVRASVRYSFGTTRIFDFDPKLPDRDKLDIDRLFPQVRLSAFSGVVSRDTRDDPLEPQSGALVIGDATVAARALGSEVGFAKTFIQGFLFKGLGRPGLVFAGGARLGLARGFPRVVATVDENGNPSTAVLRELPASERFYAGGDTTIRGFALDSVGVPQTITPSGFPKGGDGDLIFNAELRFPVVGKFGGVVFVDTGNVFARAGDVSLTDLRTGVGLGVRYRSQVGPVRFDVGFNPVRRTIGGKLEPSRTFHFSIGQAF